MIAGHSPIQEANAGALRNFKGMATNLSKRSSGDSGVDTRDSGEIDAKRRRRKIGVIEVPQVQPPELCIFSYKKPQTLYI